MTHGRHPRWIYPVLGWTLALGLAYIALAKVFGWPLNR